MKSDTDPSIPITLDDILAARKRIEPYSKLTPVLRSKTLDAMCMDRQIFFKCENFNTVGAFKIRGASNAILRLIDCGESSKNDNDDLAVW